MKLLTKLSRVELIDIRWTSYNGASLDILRIEYGDFDRALFSFWTDFEYQYDVNILFFRFSSFRD
jgi:hypothetical protein